MKKIVCLLGSPRKDGNSDFVAKRLVDLAAGRGARVESFKLNSLTYRGCQACMGCKTGADRCILRDDLAKVLKAAAEADTLVMASPIYYSDITAQLKAFIDRTFSYLTPDYLSNGHAGRLDAGKKLVFIQTQGRPDERAYEEVFEKIKLFFAWYGFDQAYLIRACAVQNPGDVMDREDIFEAVEEIALKITA